MNGTDSCSDLSRCFELAYRPIGDRCGNEGPSYSMFGGLISGGAACLIYDATVTVSSLAEYGVLCGVTSGSCLAGCAITGCSYVAGRYITKECIKCMEHEPVTQANRNSGALNAPQEQAINRDGHAGQPQPIITPGDDVPSEPPPSYESIIDSCNTTTEQGNHTFGGDAKANDPTTAV